jgi:hypothetical protein
MSCGDGVLKTKRRKIRAVGLSGDRNSADPNGRFNSAINRSNGLSCTECGLLALAQRVIGNFNLPQEGRPPNYLVCCLKGWPFRKWETVNAIDLRYKLSVLACVTYEHDTLQIHLPLSHTFSQSN